MPEVWYIISRTEFLQLLRANLSILLEPPMWKQPPQLGPIHVCARKCKSKDLSYRNKVHVTWVNFKQTHLGQGDRFWSETSYRLGALNLLLYFCADEMAPLETLRLVLNWKWSYHSILCLATEEKVGMATLFRHVKGC